MAVDLGKEVKVARPKSNQKRDLSSNAQENRMARQLDDLSEFEDFKTHLSKKVAQQLIKDVKSGMSAKELREKYSTYAQARQIAVALSTEDDSKADAAAQRILDRVEGKATEKKEIRHAFSEMTDDELEAILQSEEQELEDMRNRFEQ